VDPDAAALKAGLAARYGHDTQVTYPDVSALFPTTAAATAPVAAPQCSPARRPLHSTAQTQARIAAAIEPTVRAMLGDRNHKP
jgi:hypothetical protein